MAATKQIVAGNSTRILVVEIIHTINRLYNTSLNARTVRRRIRKGLENIPPRQGRKGLLPVPIETALVKGISSFIGLACAEQKKTPTRKELVEKISSCLRDGPTTLSNFEKLYKKLYLSFSTDVTVVSGSSSLEHRRAVYTTYNNLNIWFDTLKELLISKGFARKRIDNEDGEGELVFFPGQLNRILNLDESALTLDGNQTKSGGRSSTRFGSSNPAVPEGADRTNKSSTRITFIGGSTAAGYPLPPHFQLKSVATDENKRIQT